MSKLYNKKQIDDVAKVIANGGVVAFATETVYGLAVIFDSKEAFSRLVNVKGRSPDKPFSMMVSDISDIYKYAQPNNDTQKLIYRFMPGEVTLIMDTLPSLPEWVSLKTNHVGIRIPNDDYVRALIRKVGKPLLVTSANRSGKPPLINYEDVVKEFNNDVDAIVEGKCVSSLPSTVIDTCGTIKVLRVGSISEKQVMDSLEEKHMKIVVGCDHGGLELKNAIKEHLEKLGHEVKDVGTYTKDSVHYPLFAVAAAKVVANKEADFGILVCTSGEGISIAANKVRGIRCGIGYNDDVARLMRQHNNANMIAFGQAFMPTEDVLRRVDIFLKTPFEGGRHEVRVEMIDKI